MSEIADNIFLNRIEMNGMIWYNLAVDRRLEE